MLIIHFKGFNIKLLLYLHSFGIVVHMIYLVSIGCQKSI